MLARKGGTLLGLHQATGSLSAWVGGSSNANVASALLHDDAEDYALFNPNLGCFEDGIPHAADVLTAVTGAKHLGLVEVEKSLKVFPCFLARECRGWARTKIELFLSFDFSQKGSCRSGCETRHVVSSEILTSE